MLDVGPANDNDEDDADLAVFVERLAAAGSDRSTGLAHAQIRRTIAAGCSPPGLRRLAEALAASVTELPPPPRQPSEDRASVVAAMRSNALVVLEEFDEQAVAAAVAALLADGRRIVVTASAPAELEAVRDVLPADAVGRSVDRMPALSPAELRELRRLLATSVPSRRARAGQQVPSAAALPPPAEIADLCALAARSTAAGGAAWMIPALLADLDPERRSAVTSVARRVQRSLADLHPRAERPWLWSLLSELTYNRNRAAFDRLIADTAQAVAALRSARSGPTVTIGAALPDGAPGVLRRYLDFLAGGGRARSYFRSPVQREVQPVLQLVRVGARPAETEEDITRVVEHLELGERLTRIDSDCAEVGLPAPRNAGELGELAAGLVAVAAAARAVAALRHDVLFLAVDSPLSVPDLDAAEQIARAITEYADHGSAAEAARRLDAAAERLSSRGPAATRSPELEGAIAALRSRDADGYAAALEAMGPARREARDENRCSALLRRLGDTAPRLAESWTALGQRDPAALGIAVFLPVDALLAAVPPPDSADIVLVLGAADLGVERLLLAAVAPRMIAAVGPGERPDGASTVLSVLRRASALVIKGRPGPEPEKGGTVLQLKPGAPRPAARVGQAGA